MKENRIGADALEVSEEKTASGILVGLLSSPWLLPAVDLMLGALAYAGAWLIRIYVPIPFTLDLLPQERWDAVSHFWGVLVLSQIFFLYIFGLYDDLRNLRYRELLAQIVSSCLAQVVAIASVFYLTNGIFPRSVILAFGALNCLVLSGWRVYVKSSLQTGIRRVLVIGESLGSAARIAREIDKNPWMGLRIVGLAVGQRPDDATEEDAPAPVLGSLAEAPEIIRSCQIDEVLFAAQHSWRDEVLNSIGRVQLPRPVRIAIQPSVYEIAIGRLRHINLHDTPLIEVRRNPNEPLTRLIKRSFDVGFSILSLMIAAPFCLVMAVGIATSSPGPVFYLQSRVGRGGKIFRLIKFRTMVRDAERLLGETLADKDDPRVTRLGAVLRRFRFDEIPQFLNVLKGDMSFVGPRPERPGFVEAFKESLPGYDERHKVKPGMTGLAQVRGYYDTSPENKLRYDLAYIYNYSFSLDLLILLETIKVILVRRGS